MQIETHSSKHKEREFFRRHIDSILYEVCGFVSDEMATNFLHNSKTFRDLFSQIALELQKKEEQGWDGSDLHEDQLNLLTLGSELFRKKYKSKYKTADTPSQILKFLIDIIEENVEKNKTNFKK
jgi:hypothetical protein